MPKVWCLDPAPCLILKAMRRVSSMILRQLVMITADSCSFYGTRLTNILTWKMLLTGNVRSYSLWRDLFSGGMLCHWDQRCCKIPMTPLYGTSGRFGRTTWSRFCQSFPVVSVAIVHCISPRTGIYCLYLHNPLDFTPPPLTGRWINNQLRLW